MSKTELEKVAKKLTGFRLKPSNPRASAPGPDFYGFLRVRICPPPLDFDSKMDELLGAMIGVGFDNVKLVCTTLEERVGFPNVVTMQVEVDYPSLSKFPQGAFNALLRLEERIPQLFTPDEVTLVPVSETKE